MCTQVAHESALSGQSLGHDTFIETHSSALRACLNVISGRIVRSSQRRALRELAHDKRLLHDIGLTREQALREAGKPFWS
jgi:uncharacterized protein YjiS (DUF1127 family)